MNVNILLYTDSSFSVRVPTPVIVHQEELP